MTKSLSTPAPQMILTHSNNLDKCFDKDEHTSFAASLFLQTNVEPKTYSIAVCSKNQQQ
jgi:hypothetical protein